MKWKQVLAACSALLATGGAARADKIVYNKGGEDIIVADADGHNPRYVVRNQNTISDLSFSYDEKSVFFLRADRNMRRSFLYRVGVDGTGLRVLLVPGLRNIFCIAASPTDGRIALVGSDTWGRDGIYIMSADGGDVRLLRTVIHASSLAWRSDGKALVATEAADPRAIHYDASIIDPTTGATRHMALPGYASQIRWSANGDRLLFCSTASNRIIVIGGMRGLVADIYTLKSDGSGLQRLTTRGQNQRPCFSPDGRQVIYHDHREELPSQLLRIMNVDGSGNRILNFPQPAGSLISEYAANNIEWGPLPVTPAHAPSVLIAKPTAGTLSNALVEIRGSVQDAEGISDITSLSVTLSTSGVREIGYWNGLAWQKTPFILSVAHDRWNWRVTSKLPPRSSLPEFPGKLVVAAEAKDRTGRSSRAISEVQIDTTLPYLSLTGVNFNNSRSLLNGSWSDSGQVQAIFAQIRRGDGAFWNGTNWQVASFLLPVTLLNSDVTKTVGTFRLSTGLPLARDLTEGSLLTILAIDRAGNRSGLQQRIGPVPSVPRG